jgi:uncharacterized protein (DUF3820 family)
MEVDLIMPFGKYKGKNISEVPQGYLLYMYDRNKFSGAIKKCVESTVPVLRATLKKSK